MRNNLDCLFVHPDSSSNAYQTLSDKYSGIEPPTWSLLLAESCRSKGFKVSILDCCAEQLSQEESAKRICDMKPRVTLFVVYGQNPNAGTTNMIGATGLARMLSESDLNTHISFVGSHTSALPKQVLELHYVDSILLNEGVYALWNLLKSNLNYEELKKIKGIGWKDIDNNKYINPSEKIVPQERMDIDLPGYAWDLLPSHSKPLDLYRSHVWHGNFNESLRTPYAAIYTSLGCVYGCEFCMINIVNRTDNSENVSSGDSRIMRFWSVEWVLKQFKILRELGVKTIRISDEMFLLNHNYYVPICEGLRKEDYGLHMWAYSRVDTARERLLSLVRESGIKWLALGIEAGSQMVRQEVSKGSFKEVNVRKITSLINQHDINIIANYIVGFPEDTYSSMTSTLNLALDLNSEMINVYPCQALPGSPLFIKAMKEGWELPERYEEFAFLSYECKPLPTKTLSSAQVLEFRDYFWTTYFKSPAYLNKLEYKFGIAQRNNVEEMAKHSLKRKILGS